MLKNSEVTSSAERQEGENPACRSASEAPVEAKVSGLIAEDASRLKRASEVSSELEFDSKKILDVVRDALVDALGVDDDEVTFESLLENDLGAESIDFLDIAFRLEKNFGIKILRGELFPEFNFDRSESHHHEKVPDEVFERLDQGFNHFDPKSVEALRKSPGVGNIGILFTVRSLVDFVQQKIALNPQIWHFQAGYCKQEVASE